MNKAAPPLQASLFDASQDAPERAVLASPASNAPIRPTESPAVTAPQEPPSWADALAGYVGGRK